MAITYIHRKTLKKKQHLDIFFIKKYTQFQRSTYEANLINKPDF